jgi:hypothetical protein
MMIGCVVTVRGSHGLSSVRLWWLDTNVTNPQCRARSTSGCFSWDAIFQDSERLHRIYILSSCMLPT